MGRLESPLEAWCVKRARARGIVTAKLTQVDGIPDRVFFLPGGRPLIVEFKGRRKRGKGLQEKTQPWYIAKLRQDGYETHCCDTKEQFLALLEAQAGDGAVSWRIGQNVFKCAPGDHVYKYGRRYVVRSVDPAKGTALVELDEHDRETITPQNAYLWEAN